MKRITILILIFLIPLVYAQGLGRCNLGQYTLGNCELVSVPSGRGGSGNTGGITFSEVNLFGIEPNFNNTIPCKKGYQLYDNRCYPCDPEIGYLEFNPSDRSVLCIICPNNSYLINNTCIPYTNQTSLLILKNTADMLGKKLTPDNPDLGKSIIIFSVLTIIGMAISFSFKKDKEKVIEDFDEEDED